MSLDWDDAHYEALQMAIGALEQESTIEEEYEYIYIGNGAYEKRPKVKSGYCPNCGADMRGDEE
jgi:rRNA maturation endonuclease Nob1